MSANPNLIVEARDKEGRLTFSTKESRIPTEGRRKVGQIANEPTLLGFRDGALLASIASLPGEALNLFFKGLFVDSLPLETRFAGD